MRNVIANGNGDIQEEKHDEGDVFQYAVYSA